MKFIFDCFLLPLKFFGFAALTIACCSCLAICAAFAINVFVDGPLPVIGYVEWKYRIPMTVAMLFFTGLVLRGAERLASWSGRRQAQKEDFPND